MKRISDVVYILRSYAKISLLTRLFIVIRYLVCPWDIILSYLRESGKVLDFGTGHGLLLNLALQRFPKLHCTGIDHDQRKVEAASKSTTRENLTFISTDEIGRLVPASFDFVIIVDVLYSVPTDRWHEILSLVSTYLKPEGIIVVKETVDTPRWKYYICWLQEIIAIRVLKYTKGDSPQIMPVDYYLKQLAANRFVVEEHSRIDSGYLWPHYIFMGKKVD
ncbi:MAG: class I SAM-dependent methyltransferase [Fidelibacterota bacterium]|nr:MAG: class I SAM-dependent methyltransferase [Candidatus Neomarinimicrobiota bacterium]